MQTIKDRIIEFIKAEGITVRAFEVASSLSNGAVSKMGKNTGADILRRISNAYPQLNIDWVMTGEGDMFVKEESHLPEISYTEGVPYYDEVFECGFDELIAPQQRKPGVSYTYAGI